MVSTMGVYAFDEHTKEMCLSDYFPDQSVKKIKDNSAWDLNMSPNVIETHAPTEDEIKILRDIDTTGFYLGKSDIFSGFISFFYVRFNLPFSVVRFHLLAV